MILRRFALVIALFMGFALTQIPEFVQQYRQRLGGAIDELSAIVARFDANGAQQNLTETGAIDRLRASPERFVQMQGEQMRENIGRLGDLRATQEQFRGEGPIARLGTFATHYDSVIARGAFGDFKPALPTSPEALGLGLFGFIFGGGIVHMAGRPLRRRVRDARSTAPTAT